MTHRLRECLARLRLGPEEHVELLGDGRVPAQRRAEAGRRSRVHRAARGRRRARLALYGGALARRSLAAAARRASERKKSFTPGLSRVTGSHGQIAFLHISDLRSLEEDRAVPNDFAS